MKKKKKNFMTQVEKGTQRKKGHILEKERHIVSAKEIQKQTEWERRDKV